MKDNAVKKPRKKRALNAAGARWGDKQKQEAVEAFVLLNGSYAEVSRATGITYHTLKDWGTKQWWKDALDEVKAQDNINVSLRLQKVLSKSLAVVEDRLENGDYFFDQKLGKTVRKEVSLRDAQAVLKDSFVIKEQIEKPEVVLDTQTIADKLNGLAAQFAQIAEKKKPKIEVTDVVFIEEKGSDNAVHEEREPRLQDGVSEVPQP